MAMTFRPRVLFRQTWRLLQWRNHTFFPSNIFQSWQLKWVHNLLLSSFFLTVYIRNSCEGISSTALDSPFMAKNSVSRAIFYSVFLAFWCIIFLSFDNSSTKTISASLIAQRQRRDLLFFVVKESDHFRLRPVIGHIIVFTSENRPTNQIDSNFQQMNSALKIRSNIPTSITVNFLFTLHEPLMSSRRHVSNMKGNVSSDIQTPKSDWRSRAAVQFGPNETVTDTPRNRNIS